MNVFFLKCWKFSPCILYHMLRAILQYCCKYEKFMEHLPCVTLSHADGLAFVYYFAKDLCCRFVFSRKLNYGQIVIRKNCLENFSLVAFDHSPQTCMWCVEFWFCLDTADSITFLKSFYKIPAFLPKSHASISFLFAIFTVCTYRSSIVLPKSLWRMFNIGYEFSCINGKPRSSCTEMLASSYPWLLTYFLLLFTNYAVCRAYSFVKCCATIHCVSKRLWFLDHYD